MNRHTFSSGMLMALLAFGRTLNAADAPQLVTLAASAPNATATSHSMMPVMTPNGRFVVFLSQANNLVTNDNLKPFLDIFVRDRDLSATTLLSVDRSGLGGGEGDSSHPTISTNGRFVLFASDASNLVVDDTNNASDVFLHDRNSGSTVLVSTTSAGSVASSNSINPIMTPDARWVVFESSANDLVPGDTNGIRDLFIRDTQGAITMAVSVGVESVSPGQRFHSASMTGDGRRVAFLRQVANRYSDVYVRDLQTSNTFWASSNLVAYFNNGTNGFRCLNPVISSDGRYVAFKAGQAHNATTSLFYHDLDAGTTDVLATNSHPNTTPQLSADGQWLAFEENDSIYLRRLPSGTNLLVTINAAASAPANGSSLRPVITPNADRVAFVSSASDLTSELLPGGTNVFRIYVRDVTTGVTRLVGLATNGVAGGSDMKDVLPSISADGRLVAFDSDAADITPDDNNDAYDVFVRDLSALSAALVSVRDFSRSPRTGVQSAGLFRDSLSADGQRVLFSSYNDPRVAFDTNRHPDVFVRDLRGENLVSLSLDPAAPPATNGGIFDASLSANGAAAIFLRQPFAYDYNRPYAGVQLFWRLVGGGSAEEVVAYNSSPPFASTVPVRAALSPDGSTVVYPWGDHLDWRNMIAGTTGRITQTWNNQVPASGPSLNPTFSHNGRLVAFVSPAAFLVSNSFDGRYRGKHMYVRDLAANITRALSVDATGGPLTNAMTSGGIFSGNDRYVVFHGTYGTNQQWRIYRYDLETGVNRLVCANCLGPSVSADGQVIAYNPTFLAGGSPNGNNIFVVDLTTGQTEMIGRDYLGNPILNNSFNAPLLSANGRYVVFESKLGNLVAHDTNRSSDVFVHDRVQGTTMLISRSRFGPRSAVGISSKPVISADGLTVAFQSFADDVVEGDYNERRDIFVLRLGVGDSDNDGMDDDWEVAHFNNLGRDGTGDLDGDGQTDRQEFVSGTNPTNDGSVLRVLTVTPIGGGSTTVMWTAVPNRSYVVQFKDSLDAPTWSNASGVLTATSNSESFVHPSSAPRRFYRVIAVQ